MNNFKFFFFVQKDLIASGNTKRTKEEDELRKRRTPCSPKSPPMPQSRQQLPPMHQTSRNSSPYKEIFGKQYSRSKIEIDKRSRKLSPSINSINNQATSSKYWSPKRTISPEMPANSPPVNYSSSDHHRHRSPIYPASRELDSLKNRRASSRDKSYRDRYDSRNNSKEFSRRSTERRSIDRRSIDRRSIDRRSIDRRSTDKQLDRNSSQRRSNKLYRDRSYSRSPSSSYMREKRRNSPYSNRSSRMTSSRARSPYNRHRSRTPTSSKRDSRMRSPHNRIHSRSPRTPPYSSSPDSVKSRDRHKYTDRSSSSYLKTNEFSATSLAAELIKQKKLKRKEDGASSLNLNQSYSPSNNYSKLPASGAMGDSLSSSLNSSQQSTSLKKQSSSTSLTDELLQQQQSNGFINMRSSTLPQLPLPVISDKSITENNSKMTQLKPSSNKRIALTQLPMPPGSDLSMVEQDNEQEPFVSKFNKNKRPKIINKIIPINYDRSPRCIDVFDIICQIGEG